MGRRNFVTRWAQGGMIFTIYAYRATLGPLLGGQCRFHPTCSEYGIEAVRGMGAAEGRVDGGAEDFAVPSVFGGGI